MYSLTSSILLTSRPVRLAVFGLQVPCRPLRRRIRRGGGGQGGRQQRHGQEQQGQGVDT